MRVGDVMESNVVTLCPEETLAEAARTLRKHQISAVMVTDGERPVGILTERDIVQSVVDGDDPAVALVSGRMTSKLLTLPPEADADDAIDLMAKHGIRHVPIVDHNRLVGMISMRDQMTQQRRELRPATNFGATGVVSHFKGPYAGGPPREVLKVDTPPLDKFGLREIRRMVVIYLVLTLSIFKRVAGQVMRLRFRPSSMAKAASEGAVDGFEILGPTFVKLGQLIASSPGVFPAPLADAALRCLDEVPPFDGKTAREMIRADLGRPPAQIFKSFDDTPLSAASVGQVHACVLPDGREAVIKLQRPNIRRRMTTDLRIMYRLASTLERHTNFAKSANAVGVITDLHANTFNELNPALEAYRQDRFRDGIEAFGDNRFITAPEVYWDYCGPHMICMERMSGIPMDQFATIQERGVDGELVLRRGVKVWMEAAMVHGPFHGDVHAGNLWVLDDGRATYLDFGLMGELPEEWKQLIKDLFFTSMIDGDFTRIARAFKRVGAFPEDVGTDEEVGMRMQMVFGPMLDVGLSQVSLGDVFKGIFQMMESYGVGSPQEMILITKQLLYFERYAKVLAPDWALARDLFLVKNIFPEAVAKKAANEGITFPD
jgi:predicted unusual protein kinase regulating ubiquinone biosynthesis (AarF/ABC1/UbiB family)/CBS domain-containing protein